MNINYFHILTIYVYNICVKRTLENTTRAAINYKEISDCEWDRVALKNNIFYTQGFKFL